MAYTFLLASTFLRDLKHLEKKYSSVRKDVFQELQIFDERFHISRGRGIYKIRIPSRDMKRGKSGGFRSYLYLKKTKDMLVPLCIYAKTEREDISQEEMIYLVRKAQAEFFQLLS